MLAYLVGELGGSRPCRRIRLPGRTPRREADKIPASDPKTELEAGGTAKAALRDCR
jgi:hypothetical protein